MSLRSRLRLPRLAVSRLSLILGATIVLVLALIGVLTLTRETPVSVVVSVRDGARPPALGDPEFPALLELLAGVHLETGNQVAQLVNGDGTYPALWRDLRSARRSITVQMYYALPSTVADTLHTILTERARAGVTVLLLLDAFGAQTLSDEWRESIQAAGVELRVLRPLHWYTLHKAANRSHVRVVVVDGQIGYTGGFGLADYWLGDGKGEGAWRETNVRFTGPAVHALQAAFAIGWAEATGVLLTGPLFYAALEGSGTPGRDAGVAMSPVAVAGLLFTQPTQGSTEAERFLALTIAGARKRLWIANSYFVPNDDFLRMLEQAARQGVDVRIMTVGPKTDVKTTRWAGRARYESLLRHGVRIYEYEPTMMHAKTIVADGIFGTVGTINFDNRSLAFNNESSLVVIDSAFARQLEERFEADLRYAREIRLEEFRRRGLGDRLLERGATLLSRIL